jgi:hypothetical protein
MIRGIGIIAFVVGFPLAKGIRAAVFMVGLLLRVCAFEVVVSERLLTRTLGIAATRTGGF